MSPTTPHGMNKEIAGKYIKVRNQIETLVDEIHAIADLMSLLNQADPVAINHITAAWIGNKIKADALQILTHLDNDFIDLGPEDLNPPKPNSFFF